MPDIKKSIVFLMLHDGFLFYVDIIYINVCRLGKKSFLYYLSHRRMGENQLLEPFGGQLLLDC